MSCVRWVAGIGAFLGLVLMPSTAVAEDCDAAKSVTEVANIIQATNAYFASYGRMASQATFPAAFAKNELTRVEIGLEQTDCIIKEGPPGVGKQLYGQLLGVKSRLLVNWSELVAFEAVKNAQHAEADAKAASTVDDAKLALAHAKAQVEVVRKQQSYASNAYMRDASLKIGKAIVGAQREVDLINAGPKSICGPQENGRPKASCGTFGLYAASLSYLWVWTSADTVTARPRIASIAVPSASYRLRLVDWMALDVGAYSAFLTKSLTATSPTVAKAACSKSPTEYENRLSCEANPDAFPYFAAFAGLTAGRDGVGFVTIAPVNFGMTQVGNRPKLNPFFGLTLGVVQINGSF